MMRIVLSGTPGTGKTIIAKLLSERMGLARRVLDGMA